jgi:hypothetical protein
MMETKRNESHDPIWSKEFAVSFQFPWTAPRVFFERDDSTGCCGGRHCARKDFFGKESTHKRQTRLDHSKEARTSLLVFLALVSFRLRWPDSSSMRLAVLV